MLTVDQLRALMADPESDRVEKTTSTRNNALGRSVIRAQEALRRSGNPAATFAFEPSHVIATIRRKT